MTPTIRGQIEWEASYEVGIPSIDSQHQVLVSLIGHLQEAMLEGRTRQVTAPLFLAMNQYTKYHFEYEERLLTENGYPELGAHKEAHARLIEKLHDLQNKYADGSLSAGAPLMAFLRSWLLNHIGTHDQEYGAFLREKGVS